MATDYESQGSDATGANQEANRLFGELARTVESLAREGGDSEVDVLDLCRRCGLEIDDAEFRELQVARRIYVHPWLPWHYWFPWRPLWCWWWRRFYPYYYHPYPWWWHRCHHQCCC